MPDDLTKPVLDYGAYALTPVTHDPFEAKDNQKYSNLPSTAIASNTTSAQPRTMADWSPADMYQNLFVADGTDKPENRSYNHSTNPKTSEPYLLSRVREGGPIGITKDQLGEYKQELDNLPTDIQRIDTKDGNVILTATAPTS